VPSQLFTDFPKCRSDGGIRGLSPPNQFGNKWLNSRWNIGSILLRDIEDELAQRQPGENTGQATTILQRTSTNEKTAIVSS
jgi:hypothetical protein